MKKYQFFIHIRNQKTLTLDKIGCVVEASTYAEAKHSAMLQIWDWISKNSETHVEVVDV